MLKLFLMLIIVILPTMDCFLLKKKKDNFTISHTSLKKMFSPYLNLALLELSFYLGGGAGLGRRTVTREWSQKHVLSPLVKGDHL